MQTFRYHVTSLQRSNVRVTDELVERPTRVDVSKHTPNTPFPVQHPYAGHIPRTAMFPRYDPSTHHEHAPGTPKPPDDVELLTKSRGSGYRHEKIQRPSADIRKQKPLEWLEGPNYYDTRNRGGTAPQQRYYPIPPKSLDPNFSRGGGSCVSTATEDALKDLRASQSITTYDETNQHGKPLQNPVDTPPSVEHATTSGQEEDVSGQTADSGTLQMVQKPGFISATYPPPQHKQIDPEAHARYAELSRGWSRSDIRRKFNRVHGNDVVPDLRRKPDLRITSNERRHRFPELGGAGSYVMNGLSVPWREG